LGMQAEVQKHLLFGVRKRGELPGKDSLVECRLPLREEVVEDSYRGIEPHIFAVLRQAFLVPNEDPSEGSHRDLIRNGWPPRSYWREDLLAEKTPELVVIVGLQQRDHHVGVAG